MGQKAYFFFGPPVSFKDFCVTIGVGSSGYSGMEHFGILKLDLFGSVSFLIRFLNMWNQTKRISKINILPDPPPKNARTSTPKCPKLRRCMKYFEKTFFRISLEQQLPISPKKRGSSFASRGPCLTFNGCCVAVLVLTVHGGWTTFTFGSIRENLGSLLKALGKEKTYWHHQVWESTDPNSELFFLESTSTSPCSFVAWKHKAWSCFKTSLVQHHESLSHPTQAKASRMASPSLFLIINYYAPPHHPPKIFVFSLILNLRVIVAES